MDGLEDSVRRLRNQVNQNLAHRRRFQDAEARYTIIFHSARKKLGLSVNEYCMVDTIHKLSGNRGAVPGWCYASKEQLGKNLDMTRQGAHKMIKKLIEEKQLLEEDPETHYLRATALWINTIELIKSRLQGDA